MKKILPLIFFILLFLIIHHSAFASTLYNNTFTSDFSNWNNFYGNCLPGNNGLTCSTNTFTPNAIYPISFPSLLCVSGDYTIQNNGLNNIQISQNPTDLSHLFVLTLVLGQNIDLATSDFGDFQTNIPTPSGKHNYKICQTSTLISAYLDGNVIQTKNIAHPLYSYIGFQLTPGNLLTNFLATDSLPTNYPSITVPLLKQTDIAWGLQLYDSADKWSPKHAAIAEWGCALTDAAMILQYYHITKLPDGTQLDPGTLNSWLKTQKDGYIGNGLVNWLAITRLAKLAKASGQDPNFAYDALEYQRTNTDTNLLAQDLTNNQPDILEEPGHFVVGTGQTDTTFTINDPFYSRTDLTQGYNNTFLSLGRYMPSHTDLSYIMLVTDPSLTITLTDSNNVSTGSSYIQNPLTGDQDPGLTSGSPVKIFYAPKPSTGDYHLHVTSSKNQPYSIDGYLYDAQGNVQKVSLSGIIDTSSTDSATIHVDTTTASKSIVAKTVTLDSFVQDINDGYHQGLIKKPVYKLLSELVKNLQKECGRKNKITPKILLGTLSVTITVEKGKGIDKTLAQILLDDIHALQKTY